MINILCYSLFTLLLLLQANDGATSACYTDATSNLNQAPANQSSITSLSNDFRVYANVRIRPDKSYRYDLVIQSHIARQSINRITTFRIVTNTFQHVKVFPIALRIFIVLFPVFDVQEFDEKYWPFFKTYINILVVRPLDHLDQFIFPLKNILISNTWRFNLIYFYLCHQLAHLDLVQLEIEQIKLIVQTALYYLLTRYSISAKYYQGLGYVLQARLGIIFPRFSTVGIVSFQPSLPLISLVYQQLCTPSDYALKPHFSNVWELITSLNSKGAISKFYQLQFYQAIDGVVNGDVHLNLRRIYDLITRLHSIGLQHPIRVLNEHNISKFYNFITVVSDNLQWYDARTMELILQALDEFVAFQSEIYLYNLLHGFICKYKCNEICDLSMNNSALESFFQSIDKVHSFGLLRSVLQNVKTQLSTMHTANYSATNYHAPNAACSAQLYLPPGGQHSQDSILTFPAPSESTGDLSAFSSGDYLEKATFIRSLKYQDKNHIISCLQCMISNQEAFFTFPSLRQDFCPKTALERDVMQIIDKCQQIFDGKLPLTLSFLKANKSFFQKGIFFLRILGGLASDEDRIELLKTYVHTVYETSDNFQQFDSS